MSHAFFLKFVAVLVGGSIAVLGLGVLFGDVFNSSAVKMRGDPFYDGILDLVLLVGKWPAGLGLIGLGIGLGALFYRQASD
ncbi:MAG: hypothetical protein WA989_01735 [Henriciella sp.]|uniref:hypothetical protein n=1 Tax=Henriciella sp. TaxID=1968823 RepID=UPI003C7439D9